MTETLGTRHRVLIVGGGTAGLTVAARLRRARRRLDVAVIEPSEYHYYQPLWTLAGAGLVDKERTRRPQRAYVPRGVRWIKAFADELDPTAATVTTRGGQRIGYDFLVLAPGLQIDLDRIKGLREGLGTKGICTNYLYRYVDYTWQTIRSFAGGNAVFTNPAGPVKCGGAPQKIMYLAEEHLRRAGRRQAARVIGAFAGTVMLGVPEINAVLERIVRARQIDMRFRHDLVEIVPETREAIFRVTGGGPAQVTIPFDMIHVTPPMSAPDFVKRSALAHAAGPDAGWVRVDPYTLQHPEFANVFALGDVAALPTAKTGAAVRKQAPVLVKNLLATMEGRPTTARYDGYSSCPLVTGRRRVVLAEFTYGNVFAPTFPFNQAKERYSMYLLKRYLLPVLYWRGMLRGRA